MLSANEQTQTVSTAEENSLFAAAEINLPRGIDERSARMTRELAKILPEIERRVARDTGWPVDFTRLTFKALDEREFTRVTFADGMRISGYSEEKIQQQLDPQNPVARFMLNIIMNVAGKLACAAYSPLSDPPVVYINTGLIDNVNLPHLGKSLYHELVHHAQREMHPDFVEALKKTARQAVIEAATKGTKSPEYRDASATMTARMTWIEGQASFLADERAKEYFPGAKMHVGTFEIVALVVALASGVGRAKIMQYAKGVSAYKKVARCLPDAIDDMFENPELVDVYLKQTDGKPISVHPEGSPEERRELEELVQDLLLLRKSGDDPFEMAGKPPKDPWNLEVEEDE